jgi:6-phosphogluconolactonase
LKRATIAAAMAALGTATLVAPGAASAAANAGGVYFQSNTAPNYVQVFFRRANGRLAKGPKVRTGGNGTKLASPFADSGGFPLVDSANSVVLTADAHLLFVTNAGSDTVSSFVVTPRGITLADQKPTHGDLPVSVAAAKKGGRTLVYVVNERGGTIIGFTANARGKLTFLEGSLRPLSVGGPNGTAAMIGFDPTGTTLTVSQRGAIFSPIKNAFIGSGPDLIDVFPIDSKGLPGAPVQNTSQGEDPFGFAYTKKGRLFMTDSGVKGTVTTYSLNTGSGTLTALDHQSNGGSAPCWIALSADDRFAFVTNSLSGTVSRLRLGADGKVTVIGQTPTTNNAALDEDSTDDGRFLYVLSTKVVNVIDWQSVRVDAYKIGADGSLTSLGPSVPVSFPGGSGLAAW